MVLGGQFISRINLNLREDKGLTYGARTAFDFRRCRPDCAPVERRPPRDARAIAESIGEIAAIRGPRRLRPMSSRSASRHSRAATRATSRPPISGAAVTQIALHNLPDDYFTHFVPRMARFTPEEVTRVAANTFIPNASPRSSSVTSRTSPTSWATSISVKPTS
jgi:zinc protease